MDLFAARLEARNMHFRCNTCGSLWQRETNPLGNFSWREAEGVKLSGLDLPGYRAVS